METCQHLAPKLPNLGPDIGAELDLETKVIVENTLNAAKQNQELQVGLRHNNSGGRSGDPLESCFEFMVCIYIFKMLLDASSSNYLQACISKRAWVNLT